MTAPTLMTAAEMRAYLIERHRELEAARIREAHEHAAREAGRLKAWAPSALARLLETLKRGTHEDSQLCDGRPEADAIVSLARSLGYPARVDIDPESGDYYAIVMPPELGAAS